MKKLFTLLFVLIISLSCFAQENDMYKMMLNRNEFYFSFELEDLHQITKIARNISVDQIDGNKVIQSVVPDEVPRFSYFVSFCACFV